MIMILAVRMILNMVSVERDVVYLPGGLEVP